MTTAAASASWDLHCEWCPWYIEVGGRGARGNNPGAGVEAANIMRSHVEAQHGKTWLEFLAARSPSRTERGER